MLLSIIADETGRVAERLGMFHLVMGTATVGVRRRTGGDPAAHAPLPDGGRAGRDRATPGRPDAPDLRRGGEATPERWPKDPTPGDRVLLEPLSDVATAEARLVNAEAAAHECEDW